MADLIVVKSLTKYNSDMVEAHDLNGIDFSVEKGEFVGLFGPSGSGKTALLNVISGIENPTGGMAYVDGRDITKMARDELVLFRRQKIGYIFKDFNLLDSLTVKENIALPLTLEGKPTSEINEIVEGMMDFFGIEELAEIPPNYLTGEQKQRVSAARAMVVNPVVCYANEPTGHLDSAASANIMEMLTVMNANSGTTILMATNDAVTASYCKRVIFINDGIITAELKRTGTRQEFLSQILSTYIEEDTFKGDFSNDLPPVDTETFEEE